MDTAGERKAHRDSGLSRDMMDQLRGFPNGDVSSGYDRGHSLAVLDGWT